MNKYDANRDFMYLNMIRGKKFHNEKRYEIKIM
jgi:hypothetical protein